MKLSQVFWAIVIGTTIISERGTSPSQAQENSEETKVALSEISCRELLKMPGEDKRLTLVFFHGLMTGKRNQMVIDRIGLREATEKITDDCINNPDETLITTFEKYR